ncbi:hypothetical protein CELL_01643 [Cellulomonas sp. T2.31MG-18]|uniref:DUF4238 domain-containing protein n=1 Tax=Cellulomonas sp. T2.31MG-18 TaxID=3157619 RepID=UPI0035E57A3B
MADRLVEPQKNQHTVSRVVLRRFVHGEVLSVYDRHKDAIYRKGPGGVFRSNFDRFDWATAEQRWGAVESKMHAVYKLLDERRALDNPDAVETLRDLVAMHWVRSSAMRAAHEQVAQRVLNDRIRGLSSRPEILSVLLRQRTGLVAAGAAELDWINERVHQELFDQVNDEMFSETVAQYYEKVRADLAARGRVQIGYVDPGADLLIGDAPVITLRPGHDGVGPHQGVAFMEATDIVMPISPTILIGMGPEPAEVPITLDVARTFNSYQRRGFVRWIACRPGGASDREMRQELANVRHPR